MHEKRVLIYEKIRSLFFLMAVVPVLVFSVMLTAYITVSAWNRSSEQLINSVERTRAETDQLLQEAYRIGRSVAEDNEILTVLDQRYQSVQERHMDELVINNELGYISRYFDSRIQVYVLAENGAMFKNGRFSFLSDDFRHEDWYQTIRSSEEAIWFPIGERSRVVHCMDNRYISIGIPIRSPVNARFLGAMLVEIQATDLLSELENGQNHFFIILPDLKMQITDERVEQYDNDVVSIVDNGAVSICYRNDPKPAYVEHISRYIPYWQNDFPQNGLCSAGSYQAYYAMMESNSWILVSCISYLELYLAPLIILGALLIGILLLILLSLLIANRVALAVTKPIQILNDSVHKVGDGEFDLMIQKTSNDEIGDLTDQFNSMVQHIRELMARIIEEQRVQRKYELLLLQAQINPHFLYNSLDSIVWLIRMGKNTDAEVMLRALTEFFKTGLNRGHDTISLEQEVKNVESYMTIQQYRYRSKLSFEVHLDETAAGVVVPKLILQPLVENAIYHGIKEKEGPGCISVLCMRCGGNISIYIQDDGVGMQPQRLEKLRQELFAQDVKSRNSYGVLNVYERLRLFFHERCSLTVDSAPGKGTCVTITIREEAEHGISTDDC